MKLIDLSHTITDKTMPFPGDPYPSFHKFLSVEKDFCNCYEYHTTLHTGTHVDAPLHMMNDNRYVGDLDVNQFFGRGVLFDVRGEKTITLNDDDFRRIRPGDVVLFYTGCDNYFNTERYFHDYPTVAPETAQKLAEAGIKMVGVDTCTLDPDIPYPIHKILMEKDIIPLENLTNLNQLVGLDSFWIFALPLKLEAEASQVRAVAVMEGA